MIYFYGTALIIVLVLLVSGCITNNSYTNTGEDGRVGRRDTEQQQQETRVTRTVEGVSVGPKDFSAKTKNIMKGTDSGL